MTYRTQVATLTAAGLLLAAMVTGCATSGGNQFQNTVYDIHRRVVNLDKNLEGSVNKLNETTAQLTARVDASDQRTLEISSMLEENQRKLAGLERKLDSLTSRLYQRLGLSQSIRPGGAAPIAPTPELIIGEGDVQIVSPLPRTPPRGSETQPTPEPQEMEPMPPVSEVTPETPLETLTPTASSTPEEDYHEAQRSYARNDFETAMGQFDAFLQRYPNAEDCPNAQFWKAKCLQAMEKYDEAIPEFEKLPSKYPTSRKVPYAMHQQAVCHARLGQTQRATELLKDIVKNYPMTPPAEQAKSDLQKLQGN